MVESSIKPQLDEAQIVLRPNRSWTWRANLGLFYTLAAVSLTIGLSFLAKGLWLVLPFNVLELTVVFLCLRYLLRRTRQQEVITFTDDEVRIECGADAPERVTTFARHWARIQVTPARPSKRRRIAICSREREQDIGAFLNDDDQTLLVAELRRIVGLFATPAHRRPELYANAIAEHSALR